MVSLGANPISLSRQRVSVRLAIALKKRLCDLGAQVIYATTKRPEIIQLSRHFNGRVIETIENYFLDGQRRYLIEFRL